jgi:hypothetical protein
MVSVIESRVFATGRQLDPGSADTIRLVSDELVRQFRNADLGVAAKLNLSVVVDPFHLSNKRRIYVDVARFTAGSEKGCKYPVFHLTILQWNVERYNSMSIRCHVARTVSSRWLVGSK